MRKRVKWIGIVCLIPIVLVLLISVLLYIPIVQNFVLRQATRYASEATEMEIRVDRIRLSFPLDITVSGVEVVAPTTDTLFACRKLRVGINPLPLFHKVASVTVLEIEEARIHTGNLMEGIEVRGVINRLSARADRIDWKHEEAILNKLEASNAAITLLIDPVEKEDTTVTIPLNWIVALEKIQLRQVCLAMQMPAGSFQLTSYIDKAGLGGGVVDLGRSRYTAEQFTLTESSLNYDGDNQKPTAGLDPMHLALSRLNIDIHSIVYQEKDIYAEIRTFAAQERSGLAITSLEGTVRSDSLAIEVPGLRLQTPASEFQLFATIPWQVLQERSQGNLHALLTASIGKEDVFVLTNTLSRDVREAYPEQPIQLTVGVEGNMNDLTLQQLKAELPTAFSFSAAGKLEALTDSIHRSATIKLQAGTEHMDFALAFLPPTQREQFRIPPDIRLSGDIDLKEQALQARFLLTEDRAKVQLGGTYHLANESYKASLIVDSLEPVHFMPNDSLLWLTATAEAEGQGLDFFSSTTRAKLEGRMSDIQYGTMAVEDITFSGSWKEHKVGLEVKSAYPTAKMDIMFNGTVRQESARGELTMNVDSLDLYALHLMDVPFTTSFSLYGEGITDLKKEHKVDLSVGAWEMRMSEIRFNPKILTLHAKTDQDTSRVSLHSDDLGVELTGNADLETMLDKFTAIANEVNRQLITDSTVNIVALRPILPEMNLTIRAAEDNPVYHFLRRYYIVYNSFYLDASTSPAYGLRMDAGLYGFRNDTLLLDTIQASIRPDSAGLNYTMEVIKNKFRQQTPFTARAHGSLKYRYINAELLYTNHEDKIGLLAGISAEQEADGFNLRLYPEEVVVAFNRFKVNPNNYIKFRNMQNIDADLRLTGARNASLWIHSLPGVSNYPEVHAELNQIDLDVVSGGFADMPRMKGIFNADLQYAPEENTFMVVADMNVDNLIYENGRVGELMLNAVYLPLEKSEHQIDVHLYRDREEITTATALYMAARKENNLSGNLNITSLPLPMINPFIPDSMARMQGILNGEMAIGGSAAKPVLNGYMQMDSSTVYISMADTRLQFDNRPIEVKNSLINFNKYTIHSVGNNPFVIDGTIDISNLSRMTADLKLKADNMKILEAKRTRESLVYGNMLMNFNSTVKGPLNALMVRGDLKLLGGTDVTYVMTESPLTVQDRLKDLVTFTSFEDTVMRRRRPQELLPLGGMDVLMVINIDPAVQMRVDLTPDRSNYAEIEGGGNLSFQYTPQGDIYLNGRYTFSEGLVKYSLPVIPLKEFNIKPGSYIQWEEDIMNPLLNVTATERMRASARTANDAANRMITFEVGINIKDRLDNMKMDFMISAPEDTQMQAELLNLSADERSKKAVAMMAMGIYLSDNNSNNFNMGDALNSFLNKEIGNIAGSALQTVDISFGMDVYDNESGQEQRDFSFRFAKRFYNDRIRVIVGGRVSTSDNMGQSESALDNASVEYRLDQAGTKYVKAFYDRNYESLLEGEVIETGVGIVFRKKMRRLRELFDFRKKKVVPVFEEPAGKEKESENVENE